MHRWFWKCGILFFFWRANYIMGHFKGYFEGAKTFLTPILSRAQRGAILGSKMLRPPRIIPRNGPLCSLPKTKKNNIPNFQKSAVHWYFYVPLRPEPSILSFYVFIFLFFYCFNKDMWRKPREISQIIKKSAKVYHSWYSSSEQLQVALWTFMFFKLGWNKEKSFHILPLQSLHLLSLPL